MEKGRFSQDVWQSHPQGRAVPSIRSPSFRGLRLLWVVIQCLIRSPAVKFVTLDVHREELPPYFVQGGYQDRESLGTRNFRFVESQACRIRKYLCTQIQSPYMIFLFCIV